MNTFDVHTDNNPLTYISTTAKLYATSHCWVASLANYNFRLHFESGKSKGEANALSRIPWDRVINLDTVKFLIANVVKSQMQLLRHMWEMQ